MKCEKCGAFINDDSAFCDSCGSPVTRSSQQAEKIFCMNCGKPVPPASQACPNCGRPIGAYQNTANQQQFPGQQYNPIPPNMNPIDYEVPEKKGGNNTTLIIILIVIIVALIGGIVAFFFLRDNFLGNSNTEPSPAPVAAVESSASPLPDGTGDPRYTATPVPTHTPTPTATPYAALNLNPSVTEFMFPSDTMLLTDSDLAKLNKAQTRLLINEMYARHGYIFTTQEYIDYFSKRTWYYGVYTSQSDAEAQFNSIERENKKILVDYETARGWR